MAESIGTMSAKITTDLRGLSQGVASAKSQLNDLSKTKVTPISLGGLMPGGAEGGLGGSLMAGLGIGGGFGVATAITGAIAGIKDSIIELGATAWQIRDDAGDFGLSVEMFQALGESARLAGENMDTVTQGIVKMQKAIADAFAGEETAKKTLENLGLSAEQLVSLDTDQQLRIIAEAIASIENPTIRTRAEMDLFGKSGKKLDDILKDMTGDMARFRNSIMSGTAVNALADATATVRDAWVGVKAAIGEVAGQLLAGLGFGKQAADDAERERAAREATARAAKDKQEADAAAASLQKRDDTAKQLLSQVQERLADQQATLQGADEWTRTRDKLADALDRSSLADVPIMQGIDEQIAKTRELSRLKERMAEQDRERASLASEMTSALDRSASAEEKLAKQTGRVAEAQRLGVIDPLQAQRIMRQLQQDMAGGKTGREMPQGYARGTMEEYTRRQEAIAAAQGLQQGNVQERAARAAEQTARETERVRAAVDRLADKIEEAPVWGG